MKKIFFAIALAALVLVGVTPRAQGSGGYVVIVNSANPVDELSKTEISNFLLKKKSKWEHGVGVDPADLSSASDVRQNLSEDVHGRSVASIKNYWQRQIFSGRGVPPPEIDGDAEMIDHVRNRPGAIGYVSTGANLSGVKRVKVVG